MNTQAEQHEPIELAFLHEIGERIASSDPLHLVLRRVVDFISDVVLCDSCFVYVVEDGDLILKASKNPHAEVVGRLKLRMGQGITGWVAEHRKPVVIGRNAYQDPRFLSFTELPEDRYEAFLSVPVLCREQRGGRHQRAASRAPRIQQARNAAHRHHWISGGHGNRAGAL